MKRICKIVFDRVYITVDGEVRLCSWNDVSVGNLFDNTLYEIWHGTKADELRRSFMNEKLKGCHEKECPYCIQGDNCVFCETDEEADKVYDNLSDTPSEIILAYDFRCNHVCPHCRSTHFVPDETYIEKMKKIMLNLEPYINNVRFLDVNGGGEVFVCPEMMDMLSRFKPIDPNCKIYLETNGAMFKDNWEKIEHLSDYYLMISVTPNSFHRETYKYLAGKDDLDKFNESFELMKQLRKENKINYLRVTMVVQDSNFREIPEYIQRCLEHNADEIILRPIFKWFGINDDEHFIKNIQNPGHPYHKEYMEILSYPICKHEKVYNWGITNKEDEVTFRRYFGNNVFSDLRFVNNHIVEICKQVGDNKVVIYGAGNIGKIIVELLANREKKYNISHIAVSTCGCEKEYYCGIEVCSIEKINFDEHTKVIVATVNDKYRKQMLEKCKELGILDENIICLDRIGVCKCC